MGHGPVVGHDAVFSGPQSLAYSDIRNHVIMNIEHIRVCLLL